MGNNKQLETICFANNTSITLPKREIVERHIMEAYGGLHLLSNYCGLQKPHYFFKRPTFWQHGWMPDFCRFHPLAVCGEILAHGKMSKEPTYLVGKKADELYLKEHGYKNATAIGLPLVYLPEKEIKRIPNTLLVMPVHSLSYVKHEHWNFQNYVNEILRIKNDFEKIVICIHPDCVANGYWINEFSEAGFEIVEGAYGGDKHSFQRLQLLLSSFEYVTTNGWGSHIAYAAYFGAKISMYGSFAEHKAEDYEFLYQNSGSEEYNQMHKHFCKLTSEVSVRTMVPFLFYDHPKKAVQLIEWGKKEVGYDQKKSPKEIKDILGWTIQDLFLSKKGLRYLVSKNTPSFIKEFLR